MSFSLLHYLHIRTQTLLIWSIHMCHLRVLTGSKNVSTGSRISYLNEKYWGQLLTFWLCAVPRWRPLCGSRGWWKRTSLCRWSDTPHSAHTYAWKSDRKAGLQTEGLKHRQRKPGLGYYTQVIHTRLFYNPYVHLIYMCLKNQISMMVHIND